MKNKVRIQHNARKTSKTSQAQRSSKKSIPEPGCGDGGYHGKEPIVMTIFNHKLDSTIAGCDITAAQMQALRSKAQMLGLPIGELLSAALQGIISKSLYDISGAHAAVTELRQAVSQNRALLELAITHIEYQVDLTTDERDPEDTSKLNFGLDQLFKATQERLNNVSDLLTELAYKRKIIT